MVERNLTEGHGGNTLISSYFLQILTIIFNSFKKKKKKSSFGQYIWQGQAKTRTGRAVPEDPLFLLKNTYPRV